MPSTRQAAVFRVAAMRGEEQHRRPKLHLSVAGDDAGDELKHVVVRARGRDLLQDVAVDHLLTSGALDVDDRRLAKSPSRFPGVSRRGGRRQWSR